MYSPLPASNTEDIFFRNAEAQIHDIEKAEMKMKILEKKQNQAVKLYNENIGYQKAWL